LDIVAALDRNAHENQRRGRLTISELLKEARKEQSADHQAKNNNNSSSGRQKLTRDTSPKESVMGGGGDLSQDRWADMVSHEGEEEDDESAKKKKKSLAHTSSDVTNMLSTYPPPNMAKSQSEGPMKMNQTVSSFPKVNNPHPTSPPSLSL
jgi:hypothetical protein